MSVQEWALGVLSNEMSMAEMYKVWAGENYNTMHFNTPQHDAIDTVKRLSKTDDALRKKFLSECFRAAKAKSVKTNDGWPNKEHMMTVTVTETEKYGAFNSKTRTVKKQVPNPNYEKLTELLHGEEYFFLRSDRREEENNGLDEEYDVVTLVTESGRFIRLTQSYTYFFNGTLTPPYAKFDPPGEWPYDIAGRYCMAAVFYAEKLGKAGLDSIWNKISPAPTSKPAAAKTTAENNTARARASNAAQTDRIHMQCAFIFHADCISFDTFDEEYKYSELCGSVVFGNAKVNDYVLIGNRYYRIQSILKCVEGKAFETNEVRAGEDYVSMMIHNDRIDNAETYEDAEIAGFRNV